MNQVTVHWLDAMDSHNDEGVVEMCRETEAWQAKFENRGCLRVWKTDPGEVDYAPRPDMVIPVDRVVKVVRREEGGE